MPRRRKALLLLALGLFVCGLLVVLTRNKEPSYEGRRLSEWTAIYSDALLGTSIGPPPEPADAIRHIGTNALPWLLAWIDYEPGWRNKVARTAGKRLPKWIGMRVAVILLIGDRTANRAYQAKDAFAALGPMAATAIPQLAQMASLTNSPFKADAALVALAYIGPDALPTIVRVLSSPAHADSKWPSDAIGIMGTNARPLVPLLLERLQNTNSEVALQSALILRRLKDPELVIPALITNLQAPRLETRKLAPLVLEAFGEQARPALPALTNALSDPNPSVQNLASNAIWRITTAVATNSPPR